MSAPAPDSTGTVFEDDTAEVTRSYSEALLGAADKDGEAEAVLDELDAILADVFRANPKFAALLTSPSVPGAEKERILIETFDGRALPTVVRFLRVLNRHGRLGALAPIVRAARTLWDRRENRRPVTVRVAVPLDDGQRDALRERLARMLGVTPVLNVVVDPGVIGGLVVQVGDDVYDASIRSRLDQLRNRLLAGTMHEVQGHRDEFSQSA